MRKIFSALLASTVFAFVATSAISDQGAVKAQVEEIASGLVERLPLDQRIVLKALSPDESGLPEDFVRKLTSDLEAALLVASEFEIDLANRLSTEELWSEAVEFGDADFEELYAASRADVMLMLAPRATGAGVEINITAYRLLGEDAGQVIASSGSVVLAIDMENSLGVDVNSLNDQMAKVLQEIEKVGQTGGLISNPNTFAEYYHNARILQQRGEIDLAMRNYEVLFKEELIFLDPALDYTDLLTARYGEAGARKYVSARLAENISPIAQVLFSNLLSEILPSPHFDKLEGRDRTLAWMSWLLSASQKDSPGCSSYNGEFRQSAIKSISVCISISTGYSYLAALPEASVSSIFIDDIRSLRLLENLQARFSYSESTSAVNNSGVLPAIVIVKPSEDRNAMKLWRLLIPHLMYEGVEAEFCFESVHGKPKCRNISSSVGLSVKTAKTLSAELGFVVSPPAKTSNIKPDITCVISIKVADPSRWTRNLPIMIVAPAYQNKSFNKSDFEFINTIQKCDTPFDLVRVNRF